MTLIDIANRFHHWLAENNIPTKSFTFIINVAETEPAAKLDCVLRREFGDLTYAVLWRRRPKPESGAGARNSPHRMEVELS